MTMPKPLKLLTAKRKEFLEQEAEYLTDDFFGEDELIRPEVLANDQDIKYSLNNYNNDFKGLIHYKGGKFHIYLDTTYGSNLNSKIIRYSFAHELGHYFIDEQRVELIRMGVIPDEDENGMLSENIYEKEAEYFAACLLMPRKRILRDIAGEGFSTWLIHQISKKYRVSQSAAFSRYMVLGDVPITVITNHVDGRHDHKLKSSGFRHHTIKLDEKGYIPANTVAGRYCYYGDDDFKSENLLAADVWFNPKNEEDALRVYREDCLLQQNLKRIVSIVYEVKSF